MNVLGQNHVGALIRFVHCSGYYGETVLFLPNLVNVFLVAYAVGHSYMLGYRPLVLTFPARTDVIAQLTSKGPGADIRDGSCQFVSLVYAC